MRQTLFEIDFRTVIPTPFGSLPLFGPGLLLAVWGLFCCWWLWRGWRAIQAGQQGAFEDLVFQVFLSGGISAGIFLVPKYVEKAPVYGYGAMLLCAFFSGTWLATRRAKQQGMDPELIWDVAMWIFIPGIIGARLFFIGFYWQPFFAEKQTLWAKIYGVFNLPEGGLVLYGGVIAGILSYLAFCYRRKISPLVLADIVTPSILLGLMFGRIGCFLNGCCYGDICELPWAVAFPHSSATWQAEVNRGLISPEAMQTRWLHPTQLYSAINALILCWVTWTYFPYRRRPGEVLLVAWLIYPITRFLLEILRSDEHGAWGTPFTVSQIVSMLLFVMGIGFWIVLSRISEPGRQPESSVSSSETSKATFAS